MTKHFDDFKQVVEQLNINSDQIAFSIEYDNDDRIRNVTKSKRLLNDIMLFECECEVVDIEHSIEYYAKSKRHHKLISRIKDNVLFVIRQDSTRDVFIIK